ncbi:uncharacterized protein [Epargyreus clarus]|uniref:uncharacterized protein n=1 Tax=Epargyreus clarus TaxID=520877 RepID=UPI003C2FA984
MSMMQFEYDPERLIEEVQKRPGIWDFEDLQYRTKKVRHKLWTEVVNELMQGDVKVTKSEMRELELQLQKKWKSIRDCFQKYLKDPSRTKRPYIYSKQLQFILKNQALPVENAASSDSDDEPEKKRIWKSRKKLKWVRANQVSSEEDMADNDNENYDNQDDCRSPEGIELEIAPTPKTLSTPKLIDEFAFASVDNNLPKHEHEDPDKLFLLSLLPHLKSIPEEYRLNVKVDLMQVLRNANYHAGRDIKMM